MLVHRLRGLHVGKRGLGVCGCRGERGITSGGASEAIEVVWSRVWEKATETQRNEWLRAIPSLPRAHRNTKP